MGERAVDPVEAVFHEEWGRLLATLVRWLGDLDLAEEVAAEAIATAVERWPTDGVPSHPRAWLLITARRRAIDLLRRRQTYAAKLAILQVEAERCEAAPSAIPPGGACSRTTNCGCSSCAATRHWLPRRAWH